MLTLALDSLSTPLWAWGYTQQTDCREYEGTRIFTAAPQTGSIKWAFGSLRDSSPHPIPTLQPAHGR